MSRVDVANLDSLLTTDKPFDIGLERVRWKDSSEGVVSILSVVDFGSDENSALSVIAAVLPTTNRLDCVVFSFASEIGEVAVIGNSPALPLLMEGTGVVIERSLELSKRLSMVLNEVRGMVETAVPESCEKEDEKNIEVVGDAKLEPWRPWVSNATLEMLMLEIRLIKEEPLVGLAKLEELCALLSAADHESKVAGL